MAKKLVRFNAQLKTNNTSTKRMHVGKVSNKDLYQEYVIVEGVTHMARGVVMNGKLYGDKPFDALASALIETNARVPAPLSHPSDSEGRFMDANDPLTYGHNIGAFDADWRITNDRLVSNTYIPKDAIDKPNPEGEWLAKRFNEKQPIDRSTGLYLFIDDSKSGYGRDGEPYDGEVTEIVELNHSALLDPEVEPGAMGNLDGAGMFTNAKGEEVGVDDIDFEANASNPAMQLPLAPNDYQWNESQAITRIKAYTNSEQSPSTSYRKFFLEFDQEDVSNFDSYSQPFADIIDGVPHAVKQPLANSETSTATSYNRRFAANKDSFITRALAWAKEMGYNTKTQTNDDGDRIMLKKLTAILNAANIKTDGLDDDAILAAYNTHVTKPVEKPEVKVNEADTPKWASDLVAQVNSLSAVVNANADEKLNDAVVAVVNLKKGIDEATAKNMGLVGCQNFLAANGVVSFNASAQQPQNNADASLLDVAMPEVK